MDKRFLSLLGITLIAFVAFLEYTVINTALPILQSTFEVSILNLQWVFNIYYIVVAIGMILCGKLGDIWGRRRIFYIGAGILLAGSFLAGEASTFAWLVFARGIQAVGVAATVILAPSLIHDIFPENVHYPMSFYGTVTGIGLAVGPSIGGLIVTYINWPWIFYINIPLIIIALACCLPYLKESKTYINARLNILGTILFILAMAPFIFSLIRGSQIGWRSASVIIPLIISLISLPVFFWTENKKVAPLINFSFFKNTEYVLSTIACLTGGTLVAVALFFSPLFLIQVLHYSANFSGFILLAVPIAIVFFSPFIGKIIHKFGTRPALLIVPIVALAASFLYLAFSYYHQIIFALGAFLLTGIAWALINVAAPIGAAKAVSETQAGSAIGVIFSLWNIIAAIGIAITSVLFNSVEKSKSIITSGQGFHVVFIYLTIAMFIFSVLSLVLNKKIITAHSILEKQ